MTELFWTTLFAGSTALIIAIINQCYKSKCTKIEICCIKITRDVRIEEELDLEEQRHNHPTPPSPTTSTL